MFSIKSSFANCSTCSLLDCNSCILETNCEKDLSKVDVIIIAENPGKDEVYREVPLVGKSGQKFRKYFNKYKIDKLNYLLTNTVLCQTLNKDGTTANPDDETIERCKVNCFKIIDYCKPKLIVLMGTSPMKAFGIASSGITKLRGNIFEWNGYKVLLTIHPSFLSRGHGNEELFESDISKINDLLGVSGVKFTANKETPIQSGVYYYEIPEKFYSDEYRLIDIQYLNKTEEVIYIFRDSNNKKIIHKMNDDYYYYRPKDNVENRKVLPYEKLDCYLTKYKLKDTLDPYETYEGDLRITTKHSQDYYFRSKNEAKEINLNIFFFDIEIYSGTAKEFPRADQAKYPINMITTFYHNEKTVFVLDNGNEINTNVSANIIICKTEKELIMKFIDYFRKCDCDFCTGWNSIRFDFTYIYNRCIKLKIDYNKLSKLGDVYVDGSKFICNIPGCISLDMQYLYESFTFGKKEMYKLGFIGQIELGITKVELEDSISNMYKKNINKLIEYNIRDVDLLINLDSKLKHISLLNEIRKICGSCFSGSSSPMGRLDSLITYHLKSKGLSSKNGDNQKSETKFEGAYVKEPLQGIHDWIVDFDFTSLYPSLIQTYNIGINSYIFKFKDYTLGYDFVYNFDNFPNEVDIILDPTYSAMEKKITKNELINKIENESLVYTISGCFFSNHNNELSYYSDVLTNLISSRKKYKKMMFDAKENGDKFSESMYDNKQNVYKILANALYGILGNSSFRFFDIDLARSITLSGQEAIKSCIVMGNEYVKTLTGNKLVYPKPLTKKEMYEDLDRKTEYIITGDTDSLFITYESIIKNKDENIIDIINKWNNMVQNYLNNYVKEIVKRHNVPEDKNKLELKNELVIRRGLYLQKKRYANYILKREGKDINEIKAMGLETKRSDFSSYTKKCLNELLDLILKSEKLSITKINNYIKEKEIEIIEKIKNGEKDIARPVHWVKPLNMYKVLPQGVKGMLKWNKIMYSIHDVGSKGYLFKIQGIDLENAPKDFIELYNKEILSKNEKIEEIVIPDEEGRLPKWLIPNLKYMIKFCWQDRYKLLLEPILNVTDELMTI